MPSARADDHMVTSEAYRPGVGLSRGEQLYLPVQVACLQAWAKLHGGFGMHVLFVGMHISRYFSCMPHHVLLPC